MEENCEKITKRGFVNTRNMILAGLFAALTIIGGFIKIPLMVPITLQFLFVALAGVVLGAKYGAISQLIYIFLGLIGLPAFSMSGGIGSVMDPAFGYVIAFVPAAFIIGYVSHRIKNKSIMKLFLISFIGVLLVYAIGVPYMYFILKYVLVKTIPFKTLMLSGFIVFIPGDILKCIVVAILGNRLMKIALQVFN